MTWVSTAGLRLPDHVPRGLRAAWVSTGLCPGRDLYTLFRERVRAHPRRDAVVDDEGILDYTGLDAAVRRIANGLRAAGFGVGDVLALRLPNGREAVATELAVYALGAVALPIPPGYDTGALLDRARAVLIEPDVRGDQEWRPGPVDPEWPARLLPSSGSEAEPKLVAYSHNAFAGGRARYVRALHRGRWPMRALVLVPLASSFGSCGVPVLVATLGATLVVQDRFDPVAAVRAIGTHRPTHVFGVPTMLRRMAAAPGEVGDPPVFVASGAALPEATARACAERFGGEVIAVYGSSDGVNCHTAATGLDGTQGVPDPGVVRLRIVDEHDTDVPPGQPGEICARGPMTPLCYAGAPELDARYRLPGGWVRTGDLGLLDRRGRLRVLGRLRQVVVRGGFNISPAEVERRLDGHPAVADAACVGIADDELGERLCACVVPRGVAPTLPELARYLTDRGLDPRKLPEALLVLPELPVGHTGKVCRATLGRLASRPGHP